MSDLFNVAIVLLAGLTQASLQLSFGALILLYHASIGKHSRNKTRFLAKSYIIGSGVISFLMVGTIAFILSTIFDGKIDATVTIMILVGILLASSVVMWKFYFRKGAKTQLWLPRSFANYISKRARGTNDVIEAFSLGTLSSFAEMPISLALYVVAAYGILQMSGFWQVIALISYALLSVMPLLVLKVRLKTGRNVVEVQRWRVSNKNFLKHFSCFSFITLAATILSFWVL